MDDLISRQEAIDALDKIFPADPMRNDYTQGITCGAALATEYIKQLPSAQPDTEAEIQKMQDLEQAQMDKAYELGYEEGKAEAHDEIVCCKDCRHKYVDGDNVRFNVCELDHNKVQSDDWYCADAERRTDEQDSE